MSRTNRHRQPPLSVVILAAALACERDKQDADTTTNATTAADETSSTGGTTTTGTTDILLDTTEPAQTASTTSDSGESSTTGPEPDDGCSARFTEEVCNKDNRPGDLGYDYCLWVNIVTWDANTACPDLATGEGRCIEQSFIDDCGYNPKCNPGRIFARLVTDNIYEAFVHPEGCGTPRDYDLCSGGGEIEPVCSCLGCQ